MGQDKRFLKFGGEFLVDRAVRLGVEMSGNNRDHVFLCGSVPERKCLPDVVLGLGPLGGLLSAARNMEEIGVLSSSPWVAVFPVDMPFLNHTAFVALFSTIHERLPSNCTAISYQDFEMPFVFRCDLRAKGRLEEICQNQNPSLRSIHCFLDSIGVHRIECDIDTRKLMINANSPVDWMKANRAGVSL